LAVQLPQKDFMALVPSSKMVVLWDMQTWIPHSAHMATACPLQTEHLAIQFTLFSIQTGEEQLRRTLEGSSELWAARS
jgi:hypothetical protein